MLYVNGIIKDTFSSLPLATLLFTYIIIYQFSKVFYEFICPLYLLLDL